MQIDRITRFSRGDPPRVAQLRSSMYVHRFCEDVRLQILPTYVSRRQPPTFEVVSETQESRRKTVILFAEPYGYAMNREADYRTEVAEVIAEFVSHVANDLAIKGESFWEIAAVLENGDDENTLPALTWISDKVQERRLSIRQSTARMKESSSNEFHIDLPKDKAVIFRLPEGLGSTREQLRRLEVLEKASTPAPRFYDEIVGRRSNDLGFQLKDFTSWQFQAIAKAMRNWGWMPSVGALEPVTQFYSVIRQLQFHQALAHLRSHILCEMNAVLQEVGIETKIAMNGLLTGDEVGDLITGVHEGSTSFDQAMAPIESQILR